MKVAMLVVLLFAGCANENLCALPNSEDNLDDLGTSDASDAFEGVNDTEVQVDLECVPDCDGLECGGDGCGGSCGTCGDLICEEGLCVQPDSRVDQTSGLEWKVAPASEKMLVGDARVYCEEFGDGWRLPTSLELASLISGCDDQKDGCPSMEGPGNGGCYLPTWLIGECRVYLSTDEEHISMTEPFSMEMDAVVCVDFRSGKVLPLDVETTFAIRCVR